LALSATPSLHARVYLRWGAAARSRAAIEHAGGKVAYDAAVTVNGGDGHLTVFSFGFPIGQTLQFLKRAFPSGRFEHKGGNMATGHVQAHGHVLKLILVQPSGVGQTVVMNFEQTEREHKATQRAPAMHRMKNISPFPGSQPTFYAHNEDTDVALETSTTPSDAREVQEFYHGELTRTGWHPALGPNAPLPHGQDGMTTYVKGGRLCVVHVMRAANANESRIMVLHKRHGVR